MEKQVADFTLVETIKGNGKAISTLASGYGSGDCGIPLIAGTYYVVFLQRDESQIGICNATGPYAMDYRDTGLLPKHIEPFVQSLRRAVVNPAAKVAPRPVVLPLVRQ